MASKQPLRNDQPTAIDDFDTHFDFNFDDQQSGSKRTAGSPLKRGVSDALKSHFSRPENYRQYVGKTLPRQYGELWDDYTKATDTVRDATDSIRRQARQPMHELAKNLRGKTKEGGRVNRWLGKIVESTEDYKFDKNGAEKARQEATKIAVSDVFAGWQEEQQQANEQREEVEDDRFARQYVKLQSQERLLAGIAKGTDHHVRYLTNVDLPYRKKSLELQYRVAHGVTDMVTLMRGLVEQQRKQLDIVIKNTALPEVQKQRLSENFKQNLRNKFVDKALGGFGGEDGFLGGASKNFTDTMNMVGQALTGGLELAADSTRSDSFESDSSPEDAKRRTARWITEKILGAAGPATAGGLSKMAMRRAPKLTNKVFSGARKIGYLRNNAHSIAQQYANGDIGGKDEILRNMVGLMLPGKDNDAKINRVSGRKLLEGTHFDHSTRRSIVEVIPGYLARILQELQITRTGDTAIKPMAFNFARSTFETQTQNTSSLKNLVTKSSKREDLNEIISELERSGTKFSPEQRDELANVLISSRRSGRTMTPNSLMSEKFFMAKGAVGSENAATYSQAFKKHFDGNERGRFTSSKKGLRSRNRFFEQLAGTDGDMINVREALQDMFDTGQADTAYASGLMNQDGTINTKALYAGLAGVAAPAPAAEAAPEGKRRRARMQAPTRIIEREIPVQMAATPSSASPDNAAVIGHTQHMKLLQTQNDLTREFYVRNHEDLIAILDYLRTIDVGSRVVGEAPQAAGQPAVKPSWGDRFKNLFKRTPSTDAQSEEDTQGWRGYWNSTMRDNAHHVRDKASKAAGFLSRNFGKGVMGAAAGASVAGQWLGDKLSKSRLIGARYMKDFKDGIPTVGDLYVQGQEKVRITKAMLENGEIRDRAGKILRTLSEVADAGGDLYNDAGEVVMTQAERLRSYVRANGEVITRVWLDRVQRGATKAKAWGLFAGAKGLEAGRAGLDIGGRLMRTATAFTKELLLPPRDVYVLGEQEPRLYAYLMRVGRYTNVLDNSPISRPTQINGPVRDSDGNVVITDADFKRGLVDVTGKPFLKIVQKAAAFVRTNTTKAATFAGKAAKATGQALQTTGRLLGTFVTRGMDGVRAGNWKSPRQTAGDTPTGSGGSDQLSVLLQIRDILEERLGAATGRRWSSPETPTGTDIPNNNAPGEAPEASTGSTTTNVLGSMGSTLGSLAGGALKGLAALTRRGRASWKASVGQKPGTADNAAETTQPENAVPEPKKPEASDNKLKRVMRKLWSQPKQAVQKVSGRRTKGDSNGDGLRDGSGEEIRANWKNINAPTKTLDDVKQAQSYERQNTVDMIAGAIMSGFKSLGSVLGGAADLFTRGGAGRAAGKAAGKVGGGLMRGIGRAGGWAAGKAASGIGSVGRVLGGGLAGAGARMGMLGRFGSAAGRIAGFAGKRILMPVLGAAAATLGSPVIGTALAIGGAIWTAKEIYDYFKDKEDPVSKSDRRTLQLLRMAEYGAPLKDYGAHNKLLKMEAFLEGAVKVQGGKAELDKNQIDSNTLLSIAEITPTDETKVQRFLEWFNERYTPVYLKWSTISKAASKSLSGLEDLTTAERLKVLQAAATSDGWDVRTNPFGSEPLEIGSKEIGFLRDAMQKDWEKDKSVKGPGIKEPKALEGIAPKDALKATQDSIMRQVSGDGYNEQRNYRQNVAPALARGAASKQFATFTSEGAKRVQSGGLTALQSIRMRMYGFAEPTFADVYAIRCLEEAVSEHVKPDNTGKATFHGDLAEVYRSTAKYFALSPSDNEAESRWRLWFQNRFLPVYTTLIAQLSLQAGVRTEENLERTIDAVRLYAIAQAIAGVPGVWEFDTMPRSNQQANLDVKSIEPILNNLKAQADKQKVTETSIKPAQQTQEQRTTGGLNSTQVPTRAMPNAAQIQTTKLAANNSQFTMPNTMPDLETEPKGSGGSQPGIKPPPQMGSLMHAPGELATGNNGMQYVKAPSPQAIEGLHPEVKRLFLAMAEEYGDLTKQSIQVNRGFVTKAEQAEQYARTPEKAAPPGSSLHEFGMALDINSVDANRLEKLGLMRKYGFTRPVGGETWHIEPAGIQHDVRGLRNDPASAASAIAASVGQGGGGVGATKTGFRLGGRDADYAVKVRASSSSETKPAGSMGGFAGSMANQRASEGGGQTAINQTSGGVGGAPAANQSLYASLPQAQTKDDAKSLVQQTATAMGIDPKLAMTTVAMESGFRGGARAVDGSGKRVGSATGLNQFTKGTWSDMMKKHAKDYGIPTDTSPDDPRANAIMGVKYTEENLTKAKAAGLPADITSAYMMHFMGPAGGKKALGLQDDAVMATVFPDQAAANKPMFYNEDGSPRSKAQFMEHVNNKINRAARDFGISDQMVQAQSATPAANHPMFRKESAPRAQARTMRAPQPMGSFELQQQTDRAMSTAPAAPAHEAALIESMKQSAQIQQAQLETQQRILEQVTLLVELGAEARAATKASPPIATPDVSVVPPVSRAERSMRAVSSPAYRTGTRT